LVAVEIDIHLCCPRVRTTTSQLPYLTKHSIEDRVKMTTEKNSKIARVNDLCTPEITPLVDVCDQYKSSCTRTGKAVATLLTRSYVITQDGLVIAAAATFDSIPSCRTSQPKTIMINYTPTTPC